MNIILIKSHPIPNEVWHEYHTDVIPYLVETEEDVVEAVKRWAHSELVQYAKSKGLHHEPSTSVMRVDGPQENLLEVWYELTIRQPLTRVPWRKRFSYSLLEVKQL